MRDGLCHPRRAALARKRRSREIKALRRLKELLGLKDKDRVAFLLSEAIAFIRHLHQKSDQQKSYADHELA